MFVSYKKESVTINSMTNSDKKKTPFINSKRFLVNETNLIDVPTTI